MRSSFFFTFSIILLRQVSSQAPNQNRKTARTRASRILASSSPGVTGSSLCDLFADREEALEELLLDTLESAALMYPERVSLHGNLRGHFPVMHSPQKTAEYAAYMPPTEIEAAQRTTWWSEASGRQLRQVIIPYSNLHVSDLILIVSSLRVVLTIEQLNVRGIAESVDDI